MQPFSPQKIFEKLVGLKYEIYNSLFLTLPFPGLKRLGIKLPLFSERCRDSLQNEGTPAQIVEDFFQDVVHTTEFSEQMDVLFLFAQLVERQVVLFDALENASFIETNVVDSKGSLAYFLHQAEEGFCTEKLKSAFQHYRTRVVLTAHPTQFYPETILEIIDDLAGALADNDILSIEQILLQLGKTSFRNPTPPTPLSEATSLLHRCNNVFYNVILSLEEWVDQVLEESLPREPLVELGFWPGGDRDGNPNVTVDTTIRTAAALRQCAINHYRQELLVLRKRLTFPGILEELDRISDSLETCSEATQLLSAIDHLRKVVVQKHQGLFVEHVDRFYTAVRTFGFHFASLDLRQDSSIHEAVVISLLEKIYHTYDWPQECASYRTLSPAQKIQLLEDLCRRELPSISSTILEGSPIAVDVLESLYAVRVIQQKNGPRGLHRYVISHTKTAHNVFEVYFLARILGYESVPLDIVPLLETIEDLKNAERVMAPLYDSKIYAAHLHQRKMTQIVMLGFSDGTKDGGYLSCNWEIFQAKKRLALQAAKQGIDVVFFDGRGGPPARGGGNTHRFYQAVGASLTQRQVQLTIQGQTISSKFGTEAAARFNLEQLFTAGLESAVWSGKSAKITSEEGDLIAELSKISNAAYMQLREDPAFLGFLAQMTPLSYFGKLNVASRPMKRGQKENLHLEDLRAIPFVGAWSQIKLNIPGYFGLGKALEWGFETGKGTALTQLYQNCLFFRTLIDNAMQALAKSNESLTKYLLKDGVYGPFVQQLHAETKRTRTYVLKVSGQQELLEGDQVNGLSIALRERLILPLLVIQQYAMSEIRKSEDGSRKDAYEKLVMKTLLTITNASRNSA